MSKIPEKPKKYEERLMAAIGFEEDDLEANRAGHFSQKQSGNFAMAQKKSLAAAAFCTLMISVWLGFMLLVAKMPVAALTPFLIAAVLLLGAIFTVIGWQVYRLRADIHQEDIRSVEGRIDLSLNLQRNRVSYFAKVAGVRFRLKKKAFLAFKNGDPYSIYYSRRTKRLLSVEWLRDGEDNLLTAPENTSSAEPDMESADSSANALQFRR